MRKSDWLKGLQQAEEHYSIYTDSSEHVAKHLHRFTMQSMNEDLDIDISHGSESDDYYEGYSDFIWQKEYNRIERGIK